jgi:two-component system, OmpR family, KDP operon response regulator KdpE
MCEKSARRARVLVAENNQPVRRFLRILLGHEGYEVVEAEGGREALRLFEAEPADVVVTDLFMEDGNGLELIAALRGRESRVPIVAISAGGHWESISVLREAALLGADVTLEKPIAGSDGLLAALRRLLGEST